MIAAFATQIELDDRGVAWVRTTGTKVKEIALDKIAHGWSPDEMHDQHPHLSLAQIHAALTYYYENQAVIDEQIQRDEEEADRILAEVCDPDFHRRLRDRMRSLKSA